MNEFRTLQLDKVYGTKKVGFPMTPSRWVSDAQYTPVIQVEMTAGGGLGGKSWKEILVGINSLDDLTKANFLTAKTWDGRTILLNMRYMVKAEELTLVTRDYYSTNYNYGEGRYTLFRLIPKNAKIEKFVDEFIAEY